MIKPFVFAALLFLLNACNSIQKLYIPMTESKDSIERLHGTDEAVRIFFDRNGFIYPDFPTNIKVTDADIKKRDSRLACYYQSNPLIYKSICDAYKIKTDIDLKKLNASNDPLQQELISRQAAKINNISDAKTLVFIIHGYNKHPLKPLDRSAFRQFKINRDSIQGHFRSKEFQFVEIYWDGLSQSNGSKFFLSRAFNSFKIWDNAQASALYASVELRRILSSINNDSIFVITHSHGAALIQRLYLTTKK